MSQIQNIRHRCFKSVSYGFGYLIVLVFVFLVRGVATAEQPSRLAGFIESNCLDCHSTDSAEGGLVLGSLEFYPETQNRHATWVSIHDRIKKGEMPPPNYAVLEESAKRAFLDRLSASLVSAEKDRVKREGRSAVRRLNRDEYENTLRDLLGAPWLMVADELPADGTAHHFSKSGEYLDVSHVQLTKYLEVGKHALRTAVDAAAHPSETHRYYARREKGMNYVNKTVRANIPVIGWKVDAGVMAGVEPKTAPDDPELREREALAVFYGPHPAYTRYDFLEMDPPIDGQYRLRMKSYSIAAGTNGFGGYGLDPEKPAKEKEQWYRPNRLDVRRAERAEPISLYALRDSGDTRWLANFDANPEPHVIEKVVTLKAGDHIRPDASRLCRLRPGWGGNPLAVGNDHIPGWALQWLELEGPISETWPPISYQAVFDDLSFHIDGDHVRVETSDPDSDARRLLSRFAEQAYRGEQVTDAEIDDFVGIYLQAREMGYDFTDAMITACSGVIASPGFLYLDPEPGQLNPVSLASRLAYFLWNCSPDRELLDERGLTQSNVLREQTDRLIEDSRFKDFVNHFLDYWLELRNINNTVPDAELYPDYFLDSHLTESAIFETRRFFESLVRENLPARNLIDSDFAFVNERMALHYLCEGDGESPGDQEQRSDPTLQDASSDSLDPPLLVSPAQTKGVRLRKMRLPEDSRRGGLMTQASVLKVTANGTTTSPVLRGVWIVERLLGNEIPEPPSGVEAIEPDTRGATTIKEQLSKHIEVESCAECHRKFDPVGFALENFDVMGGWRDQYRALGETGEPVEGYGFNGHAFTFRRSKVVEGGGQLVSGETFDDIHELKKVLLKDERAIAKNLLHQLVVYATGTPVGFSDRGAIDRILDDAAPDGYRVRDMIHGVVQSSLFRNK